MVLKKITRQDIEKMHKTGALKKVGLIRLESGENLKDADLRDYLIEKNKKYKTVTSFEEAVKKDTAKNQWRQRKKFSQVLKDPVSAGQTAVGQKETALARKKNILDSIFGREKKEQAPIKRGKILAGKVNLTTGEYEEEGAGYRNSVSMSSRPKGVISGGVGGTLEQAKKSSVGAFGQGTNAIGINSGKTGFSTISSIINKK